MTTPEPLKIDPSGLKLPPSMSLEQVNDHTFILTIKRKSRIIMQDGRKLLEKLQPIRARIPAARIEIRATAPICSKTQRLLTDKGFILGPKID
jgi:hypothetical protein